MKRCVNLEKNCQLVYQIDDERTQSPKCRPQTEMLRTSRAVTHSPKCGLILDWRWLLP